MLSTSHGRGIPTVRYKLVRYRDFDVMLFVMFVSYVRPLPAIYDLFEVFLVNK
jgi:hypothetical protein